MLFNTNLEIEISERNIKIYSIKNVYLRKKYLEIMAGHSHWAGIKHRKGRADEKRAKIFSLDYRRPSCCNDWLSSFQYCFRDIIIFRHIFLF